MLFITSDLHLPGGSPGKDMGERFPLWRNYRARLEENWRRTVGADDTVVVAGDISWALKPAAAAADLAFLDGLPGRSKLLLRGNHDYWLPKTEAKQRQLLAPWPTLALISRSQVTMAGPFALAGTRLWELPTSPWWREETSRATYEKEKRRLAEALAVLRVAPADAQPVLVVHHPPHGYDRAEPDELERMIIDAGIRRCHYGHLHPAENEALIAFPYVRHGVTYQLVSVDSHAFTPLPVTAELAAIAWPDIDLARYQPARLPDSLK